MKLNVLDFVVGEGWNIINLHADQEVIGRAGTKLRANNAWISLFEENKGKNTVTKKNCGGGITVEDCYKSGFSAKAIVNTVENNFAATIKMELVNGTKESIILNSLRIFNFTPGNLHFRQTEKLKVYADSGSGHFTGVVDMDQNGPHYDEERKSFLPDEDRKELIPFFERDKETAFHNSAGGISLLYSHKDTTAFVLSTLTWKRCSSNVIWCYDGLKKKLVGWASCNFAGYELKPGESIQSETFFVGLYSDPLKALEEYASISAKEMKISNLPLVAPLGWCSWYAGYSSTEIGEWNIIANAKGVKNLFPDYGFKYIQADLGWNLGCNPGDWTKTNERFPHGLQWLSDRIREEGLELGLWLAPFNVAESSQVFQEHPEYMVKNSEGKPKSDYKWFWPPQENLYYLDPTHPGAQKWLKNTLLKLRKVGVHYWKLDFILCIAYSDTDTVYYNNRLIKGAEVYRTGLALIEETLKGDYIYWCSNAVNLGFGTGSTSMTAVDIGPPGFSRCRNEAKDSGELELFRSTIATLASRYFLHKKLSFTNPDVVEVRGDYEEAKIRLSLVGLSGGQTFLGDIISKCRDAQMLTKCLPAYGTAARPVDLFYNTYPKSYPKIWHLHVNTDWGGWEVVGIFNLERKSDTIELKFNELGLSADKEYMISEFWEQKFLGLENKSCTVKVPPISMKLLLVKEVPKTPWVFFTDMHYTQGGVELVNVRYDKNKKTLSGQAIRQKGATGIITVYMPSGYKCENPDMLANGNLLHLDLDFSKNKKTNWQVKFIHL